MRKRSAFSGPRSAATIRTPSPGISSASSRPRGRSRPGRSGTAERYNLQGEPRLALVNAEQALKTVPSGTPDWLRAQDIAMVSRTEVEKKKKNRDN